MWVAAELSRLYTNRNGLKGIFRASFAASVTILPCKFDALQLLQRCLVLDITRVVIVGEFFVFGIQHREQFAMSSDFCFLDVDARVHFEHVFMEACNDFHVHDVATYEAGEIWMRIGREVGEIFLEMGGGEKKSQEVSFHQIIKDGSAHSDAGCGVLPDFWLRLGDGWFLTVKSCCGVCCLVHLVPCCCQHRTGTD